MVKKGKAITDGEAQNVSGGYVHETTEKREKKLGPGLHIIRGPEDFYEDVTVFEVINDVTGERMGKLYDTKEEAQKAAAELGQKTRVISDMELGDLRDEWLQDIFLNKK